MGRAAQLEVRTEAVGPSGLRQRLTFEGRDLSRAELLDAWRARGPILDAFLDALRAAPFDALFWETPAWTRSTMASPYEHVVVDAPALARLQPDPGPFAEHFGDADVVCFDNLGGDATLVVPCPASSPAGSAHLAAFLREAPAPLAGRLLERTARALAARLGDAPRWVSTSGLGVSWVHVRIDRRPKYYTHGPYRRP